MKLGHSSCGESILFNHMKRNRAIFLCLIGIFCTLAAGSPSPNIVVFLADDFGYGCTNAYGADEQLIRTPNLNRLAAEGIRFDNAYTTGSVCSPTRYALLTGRYSWRTNMKRGVVNSNDPLLIKEGVPTIASWLREQGYETAQIGKWHLGYKAKRFRNLLETISPGPNDVGFDYHFGVPNNMDDLHKIYIENDRIYGLRSDKVSPYGKSFYGKPYVGYDAPQRVTTQVMDTLTEKAIHWLDHRDKEKPFFLYFTSVAVHHPISPSERMRGTSEAGAYGDFIHDVDHSVGQLMEALDIRGLSENTLFLFSSDNGSDIPKDAARPEAQAVAKGLAVNGTLRGDKHTIYDGGLKVPFIVKWPGGIEKPSVSDTRVSTIDVFATVADIVAGEMLDPNESDSVSFRGLLKKPSMGSSRPELVLRDSQGRKALLKGAWKFVDDDAPPMPNGKKAKLEAELYNLATDPSETLNVIKEHPEIVTQYREILAKVRRGD